MKKTLLCFLFLFTANLFYAQPNPNDIVHCNGDNIFDLTSTEPQIIKGLNPAETTVSYHLTVENLNANIPISNPKNYISDTFSKIIYVRAVYKGIIYTNYFNVIVQPYSLTSVVTIQGISCKNEKGSIIVTGSGGKPPHKYSLNGGNYVSTNEFTNLTAGVYVVNTKDDLGCIVSMNVIISPRPIIIDLLKTNVSCFGTKDGSITVNASSSNLPLTYTLKNNFGIIILNSQTTNVFKYLAAGIYNVEVKDANGCITTMQTEIQEPTILHSTAIIDKQTITINATGGSGKYLYSIDYLGERQSSNVFTNVSFGDHEISIIDENGCINVLYLNVNPPAPLINGKNNLNIEFTPGQTLGDLMIEGQNIKWYSSSNSTSEKSRKTIETTLPLTTVLVDGVTYYASQTINGIESKERLSVMAKVKGSLSTEDFVLPNFRYYPNPAQHALNISNSSTIDEVEIISISGKSILSKKVNDTQSEIDLSNVSSGFYFLKIKSEEQTKTIKIVKK